MKKRLIVTPDRCIGCKTCELACAFRHAKDLKSIGKSRVTVYSPAPEKHMAILCLQCEDAACMKVCPTEALVRNESTLAVDVIDEKCIRCGVCTLACPFGNISMDIDNGVAVKCDLCKGQPACARFCPTLALEFPGGDRSPAGIGLIRPAPGFIERT
jgi:Fe-S-cluster-containing hydrogenase component 2